MDNPSDFDNLSQMYGEVSRVISFRLNPKDAIEAKALAYLTGKEAKGGKAREIIARALAQAADRDDQLSNIEIMTKRILHSLDDIASKGLQVGSKPEQNNSGLKQDFKQSLLQQRRAAKRIDDEGQGE